MGDTFTPVNGYLAGIYRSLGATVGVTETHQLLLNSDFETEDLTSWTDDCVAASTATATDLKGWNESSWGVVMDDDGTNLCGISQIVELASAVTAGEALTDKIIASVWVRFDAVSDEATLKVTGLSAADADLGNGSVTLISAHPGYDDGTGYGFDGYFSVAIDAIEDMIKFKVEIYSNAATAQVWNIDNVRLAVVEQVAGAFGSVTMPIGHDIEETTTFADAGFRSYASVLKKVGTLTFPTFWVAAEGMGSQMAADQDIYVVLWSQKATATSDRFEFLGKVSGVEWAAPVGELQKGSLTITANGLIGYADR